MKKNLHITFAGIAFIALVYIGLQMFVPAQPRGAYREIEIPKGATFRQAAELLVKERLIKDKNLFVFLGRITGADRRIRAGYYSIWGSMSPYDIFRILRKGQIIEYEIRIVEGDSIFEISQKLADAGIITKENFLALARNPAFLSTYDIEAKSVEGYIFPDTYKIPKGTHPELAIGNMIDRMRQKFSYEMLVRSEEIGMTENEVLTLASIIEKEAVVDSERTLISAVYHNRLKKKMPLQADPTSVYGIKSSREKITTSDLLRKTPYNTYVIKGLPPGPIASPGLKSIVAALYPADVPYLYFVSEDDLSHKFSTTADEHLEAVRQYREKKQILRDKAKETRANTKADET